ncbi:U2 small nuclear ribonucleoprotein A'-like [Eriocheir sinensis]|uniref:U2 small nuclear ribonucleoprotein A'-like n=1 Tax=Eriocheir sinensis TaxID=95602 RepID=UPI0021C6F3D6|nr:U2 small nuclear ribonucleoprotein A'-like [Eriocheir sinensis]
MVKLTPELIQQSSQHINPLRDRELCLRGYKIPVIENLGATLDQFDIVDFSDNDIRKLDGFPLLKRLKTLLLNNNRIVRISDILSESLPNLQSLFLTNNLVQELADLDSLAGLKKLEYVSLLGNPVTTRDHYRLYLINKVPQVRVVDFRRVRLREREMAKKLFKSKLGKEIQKEAKKVRTFVPGVPGGSSDTRPPLAQMSAEDQAAIRQAISNARSMEEVERLQHMLRTGNIPSRSQPTKRRHPDEEEEN